MSTEDGVEMPHAGAALRAGREAVGLTVEQVAEKLKLTVRQINALEADDFSRLPEATFVRGFVRNYARLLGMKAEPLLPRAATAPTHLVELPPMGGRQISVGGENIQRWIRRGVIVAIVVLATPALIYAWLDRDLSPPPVGMADLALPIQPQSLPATPPPVASANANPPAAAPGETPPAQVADAAAVPAAPAAPAVAQLRVTFAEDAWVDIRSGSENRILMKELGRGGTERVLEGKPPFVLVVGNAHNVKLTYNGHPVDLEPFIDVKVARLTLE